MVAEGNFYISEVVIRRELKSKFALAMEHCKDESTAYGRCIDASQVNRNLQKGSCYPEQQALRKCVDGNWSRMKQSQQ